MRRRSRLLPARLLAGLAAVSLAVTACTGNPPPPQPTEPTPTGAAEAEPDPDRIVVGVDSIEGGYNPHKLADASTATAALARLLLPSVFREGPDGEPVLDETVMDGAEVIEEDPFTVEYRIRQDAAWSDGAPIRAADFLYLAEVMRAEPGTIDPAGYRLIDDIASRDGGKRVEVRFREPYPGWRSLFVNLLPGHLLKDSPGGWPDALADSFPAYGGPFAIEHRDTARGELVLERNERYWDEPAEVDRIVLREASPQELASSLRAGSGQLALTASPGGRRALQRLGDEVELHTVARPEIAEVQLRAASPLLADEHLREAVVALLDREALLDAGAGAGEWVSADAQVLPPSAREYTATMPERFHAADADRAERAFGAAGYRQVDGRWQRAGGQPLELVIGVPGEREPYGRVAEELAGQLERHGVSVEIEPVAPRELVAIDADAPAGGPGTGVPEAGRDGMPDIAVAGRAVGHDPAATLASRMACLAEPSGRTGGSEDGGSGEAGDSEGDPVGPVAQPRLCTAEVRSAVTEVLTGEAELAEVLDRVEPELWRRHTRIPLFQRADTLAVTGEITGVEVGESMAGAFGSAAEWRSRR
ncbi:ABC transporter family substrate-binding protein [Haloechinothrix sp. LS1_15]|uniref:ABC transporter family substrate-binding protein n=1 Tax=Haloechinothrix sp. LS1_15 TaxID=2652248 RepID=UPI0029484264|nr:ABC transporter family substrate-binding protein [Haloechinothrix sp. LS1_15]MDV6011549.1 ABC transporter family substrate-binding protein [Haloechinothrix sp. LS1_15]